MSLGAPLDRVEGRDKVVGTARYAYEAPIPASCHAAILQTSFAKGRITRMDVAEALAAPGVLGILTPENMPKLAEGFSGDTRAPLSDWNVIFAGQHLAVVIAES